MTKLVTDNTNETMARLAGSIRLLRAAERMSIREFADKIGVNHSNVLSKVNICIK